MGVQPIKVPPSLALVLNSAGERNGVDFDYLLQTAIRESALNPSAKAQTSTATGLFQFLESTWLEVMKDEGPRLGYQQYADAITIDSDGDYMIKDKKLRQAVLALREDPQIAADLAAAFTKKNGAYLYERFGRMPSPGELYIAHFLGAKGAEKMFTAGLADPDQIAAKLFPRQAKANPSIFYELGKARTIKEVYRALVSKHETTPEIDANFAAQQFASGNTVAGAAGPPSKWPDADPIPSRFSREDMSFVQLFSSDPGTGPVELFPSGALTGQPLVPVDAYAPVQLLPSDQLAMEPAISAYGDLAPAQETLPNGTIKPRVLMTKTMETPAEQVLTNMFSQP